MRNRVFFFVLVVTALMAAEPALSQKSEGKTESTASTSAAPQPKHHYKLHFVLKETAEGNVTNQRAFTLGIGASAVRDSERASLRAGTRIPLGRTEKGMEYADIGTDLDVYNAVESPEGLLMFVNAEISSAGTEALPTSGPTPIRRVRASSAVLAPVGKPALVFTADDPASKHKFELDVTAVREP